MKNKSQLYFGITFLLVFSLFFFNISSSEHDELLRTFSNAFHFPVFMMFSFFFLASYKSRGINWSLAKFKTFFLLTFLAIFIEIVQPYFGRSQSFRDFLTGVIGIVLSFPIYQAFQLKGRRRNLKKIFLLSFFSFSVFIVFLIPTLKQAYLLLDQKRAFPNLLIGSTYGLDICEEKKHLGIKAIFEPENYAWLGIDHENVCWRTLKGLNIDKNSNRFSGVEYLANGQNWSGYENLKLLILIDR
ncbi:MAG: VanZ family protein, partial [Proteobacteria bacterium]|nr:VanZ family protein [Pseudomonadota bacterium]